MLEDATGDLLEVLELHLGVILEHFGSLENGYVALLRIHRLAQNSSELCKALFS